MKVTTDIFTIKDLIIRGHKGYNHFGLFISSSFQDEICLYLGTGSGMYWSFQCQRHGWNSENSCKACIDCKSYRLRCKDTKDFLEKRIRYLIEKGYQYIHPNEYFSDETNFLGIPKRIKHFI